jgi:hypothetical protein
MLGMMTGARRARFRQTLSDSKNWHWATLRCYVKQPCLRLPA